jgi:LPS sulfotransferase NodH
MPKVDNDPTKTAAQPFLIIAGVRCGGTYLAHCLSNHPSVFCDRGESMHRHSLWRQHKIPSQELLHILLNQEGYRASGFRMVHSQAFSKHVWRYIVNTKPNIIHLTRDNIVRQATSLIFHRMVRAHKIPFFPVHTFKETKPPDKVTMSPELVLKTCRELARQKASAHSRMANAGLKILTVEYGDMVGGEGVTQPIINLETGQRICIHLGVSEYPLACDLKRVHQHPLRVMIRNWRGVEAAIAKSEFVEHLKHEIAWYPQGGEWKVRNA